MPAELFRQLYVTDTTLRYFDGQEWKESESGNTIDVISPRTGNLFKKIQAVSQKEIDDVLQRLTLAQPAWEETPLYERIKIIHKTADAIRTEESLLTDLLVEEIGKSKKESRSEVLRTADLLDYFAQEVQSISGQELRSDAFPGFTNNIIALAQRVAHGVILAIGPFNYPINLVASKIAPALLMGNAVVVKPPTQGSVAGAYLTALFVSSGVSKNIIACVTGSGKTIGSYVASHRLVQMIAFTGSSETGEQISHASGMKPFLFECGGNNAALVLNDADMNLAAEEIVKGGFSYAGQRCTGLKYVLCPPGVEEVVLPKVIATLEKEVHMGDPKDENTKLVGPLISQEAAREVEEVILEAVSSGAKIVYGGKRNGFYVEPTVITQVTPDMRVIAKETFGPVVCFVRCQSAEQAIHIINGSVYGLQASIFTKDEGAGIAIAKKVNVGTVQINGSPQRGPDHFPFLGVKKSGLGVQGVSYSLLAVSRLKSVVLNKPG